MNLRNKSEERKRLIKEEYDKIKNLTNKSQANLELNYYIQKKMMDHPDNYMEEIKKDIERFAQGR